MPGEERVDEGTESRDRVDPQVLDQNRGPGQGELAVEEDMVRTVKISFVTSLVVGSQRQGVCPIIHDLQDDPCDPIRVLSGEERSSHPEQEICLIHG